MKESIKNEEAKNNKIYKSTSEILGEFFPKSYEKYVERKGREKSSNDNTRIAERALDDIKK